MSRGSPRHSFSPVRPMNQALNNDRRRTSSYVPHSYDRPFTPSEANRTEPQPFRSPWEDKDRAVPSRPRSPIDSHGGRIPGLYNAPYDDDRSYRPVTPFQDRQVNSGPSTPFRDRAGTPNVVPGFAERPVTPAFVSDGRPPGNDHWSPGVPQIAGPVRPRDEAPLGDHWSPGASQVAGPSSSWDSRGQRPDSRNWASRKNVSPPYNGARTPTESSKRPLLEPSQAWRRAREERDRQLSIEYRTIIPADHRGHPPDGFTGDGARDSGPSSVPMNVAQNSNDVPDFQARRFRQQPQPPPLPARFDQRSRYPDRFQASNFQRHVPQTDNLRPRGPGSFSTPRRPQARISARISARPKRSPSPSDSDSSTSARPGRRSSRSQSRSGRSRSRVSSPERDSRHGSLSRARRFSSPRRYSPDRRPGPSSPIHSRSNFAPSPSKARTLSGSDSGSVGVRRPAIPSAPSSSFTFRSPTVEPARRTAPPRRSSSASSRSSQSSIRSSVHSSPVLVATEISPVPHANTSTAQSSPVQQRPSDSQVPPSWLPPQDDTEFELPGMRFQKDGALKPGFAPPSLESVLDIHDDLKGEEQPRPELPQSPESPIHSEAEVDKEAPSIQSKSPERISTEPSNNDSPADKAQSVPLPSPSIASDKASIDVAPLTQSSPIAQVSQSQTIIHISAKPSGDRPVLQKSKEQNASQPMRKQPVTVDAEQTDAPRVEAPKPVDLDSIAPDSSPLSEPMPLSPPPELPALQEDVDDSSSSMDLDDESNSEPADDIAAALRVFVKAREGKDHQTRNERYDPILRANDSLVDPLWSRNNTSNEEVVREVMEGTFHARLANHSAVSQSLLDRFTKQAEDLAARTSRLRAEYKSYHDRWVANCRKLDQSMASSASQGAEGLPVPSGRVTRRSTNFGDAVRSDLEMEQIIASLGNEDMTDPNVLAIRNTAVIPDLVSTDPFAIDFSYDDNNGIVDEPEEVFDVYDALGRWTDEEKETYLQKYGMFPKQFGAIASFLPSKTPAQCVMFYYLHKKELIDFRGVIAKYGPKRKRRGGRKAGKGKGNALLADIMKPPRAGADDEGTSHKHSDRFRADLQGVRFPTRRPAVTVQGSEGEPSRPLSTTTAARGSRVAALHQEEDAVSDADSGRSSRQRPSPHIAGRGRASPSEEDGETGTVVAAPADDRRKRQARFVDPKETASEQETVHEPVKKTKLTEKVKEKRPPGRPPKNKNKDRAKVVDKDGGSPSTQKTTTSYVWSKGEEANYLQLVARHGKDFDKIAGDMPAKTAIQCRNYFRNHAKDLDLERIAKESEKSTSSSSALKISLKDKGASKTTKSKDVVNGEGDAGGSGTSRSNRSRQINSGTSSKVKEKQVVDPTALTTIFTPPASTASNGSASTRDASLSKRLPNFTKSKK